MRARRPVVLLDRPSRRGSLKRVMVMAAAVVVALAAVVVAALQATPWLVERSFQRFAAGAPDRVAAADDVRFDPRSLTLELYGFELRDGAAGIAVTAPFATLDFDWRGFVGFGPRSFERIAIERPRLETRSVARLLAAGSDLARGPLAGLRIAVLEIDAGELAIAPPSQEPYGLVGVDVALTAFDAARGDGGAGHVAVTAATTGGAGVELDGTVHGLERIEGRLGVRGQTLAGLPAWLGTVPLTELHATLDLDGDYVLTAPLTAARFEMAAARLALGGIGVAARGGLGARAERLEGTAALTVSAVDGGGAVGSARLNFPEARIEISDGKVVPSQTFPFVSAAIAATLDSASKDASLELTGRLAGSGDITLRLGASGTGDSRVGLTANALPAAVLSPYAVASLGQQLAAGVYDLALDYRQSAGRVAGEVRVGAASAVFAAAELPPGPGAYALELAVALLENADGVAEIDAEFAGAASDVRAQVGAALEARIAALAAAPFEALAPLAPLPNGSPETLRSVAFAPGDTELGAPGLATVDALAAALVHRPRLGVRVHGAVDPEADRLALARSQIELHVALATADAVFQARPEPVDFASPRAQDILDEFAGERLPPERVTAIARSFNCGENPPPACRTAYYAAIFDALADNEPIPDSTVTRLGRFRAQAVAEAFEQRGIGAERIAVVAGAAPTSTGAGGIALPLELFPRSRL